MPWLRHKTYVELVAKREEASDKREEARNKRDLKELVDAVEALTKTVKSLSGYLYRNLGKALPDDEEETDDAPAVTVPPIPGGWGQR